ncbi:MAG: ABC transporter substrate-binding protein [Methylobacteriaceae bacterium]|nr:ABC transporter substrate-binding protein [Methylobacteriaceae bacterium]
MLKHIIAITAVTASLAGARADDEPKLVEAGKLTWGSSPTFVPFEFMRDGKPVGFDVDLMEELAKRSGFVSTIMPMEFKGVLPALLGNRIDAGVSGLYVTAERQQVADFVPYAIVGNQILVLKGNSKKVDGPKTLCGLKVGVPVSTAFEVAVKKASDECKAAGKSEVEILSLPGSNNVALALQQGRVDAAVNSTATSAAMMSESPGTYELGGIPFDANTKVGIALRRDEMALKAKLETAIQAMVKDGAYAALLKKWNLPEQSSAY